MSNPLLSGFGIIRLRFVTNPSDESRNTNNLTNLINLCMNRKHFYSKKYSFSGV